MMTLGTWVHVIRAYNILEEATRRRKHYSEMLRSENIDREYRMWSKQQLPIWEEKEERFNKDFQALLNTLSVSERKEWFEYFCERDDSKRPDRPKTGLYYIY
jgi:hypothetical protein